MNQLFKKLSRRILPLALLSIAAPVMAGVGDPQTKTDHPWYPGELAVSTFDRLFQTEADQYQRVTGRKVDNDEDKVLASWMFRNINYYHNTECLQDNWGKGPGKGGDSVMREYWNGLFGYGFGICFETHDQWAGEMHKLLGPARSRSVGVDGHTTFEVFIKGGPYGDGQWVLLDHDIATIVFNPDGTKMESVLDIAKDMSLLKKANQSRGWPISGLAAGDTGGYAHVKWTGSAAGYAGAPPMVHLRTGESIRRYAEPGLEDGHTYVFWGMNLDPNGIPGPTRDRTFVNQPDHLYKNLKGSGSHGGQSRYGNAVYTYKPDFASDKYKEGVIDESADHVTFEFYTPYTIASTPADLKARKAEVLYDAGGKNGLVLKGKMTCPVEISVDQGKTWTKVDAASDGLDLTDHVKGHRQYFIKFDAPASALAGTDLTMTTVCQCNPTIIPHVKDGKNTVTFEASGQAELDAGPDLMQEQAHVVDGALGTPKVTLKLQTPHEEPAVWLYVSSRQSSGAPPADIAYNIEYSTDNGATWNPVVKDFKVTRQGKEADDFWSQSFAQGDCALKDVTGPILVRYSNSGNKNFQLAEAHLVYKVPTTSPVKVTYVWKEGGQVKTAEHTYPGTPGVSDNSWTFDAGNGAQIDWVEYSCQ